MAPPHDGARCARPGARGGHDGAPSRRIATLASRRRTARVRTGRGGTGRGVHQPADRPGR